jgi:C4-dicarboxylate-binding protein DctP
VQIKSKWISILILLIILFAIAGCRGEQEKNITISEQKIIMKIGHTQPINHPRHQSLLKFKQTVETKTNNMVEVQVYPAAQLGSDLEQMQMVKDGRLQAMRGNQIEVAAPELLIYTMPFLFDKLEEAHQITRGPIGEKIARFTQKNNIVILATGDVGDLRDITNNVRPIVAPKDMQGLRMRTTPIESTVKTLEALGASVIPVDYDNLYNALKTGVVDGQENPLINIRTLKLEQVQKYLTIIKYQYYPDPFFVNLAWYDSLEPAIKVILKEASVEMMLISDELIEQASNNNLADLKKSMIVNTLTHEQRKRFVEQTKPVYDYYIGKGLFTVQDLEEIRNAVK